MIRTYHPIYTPPRWWERILIHPMENVLAVLALTSGAIIIAGILIDHFQPSRSMADMPWLLVLLCGAFTGVGGILALTGLHWRDTSAINTAWGIERTGWILSAGGFFVYAIAVAMSFPNSVFSWLIPTGLGIASSLRAVSLLMIWLMARRKLGV